KILLETCDALVPLHANGFIHRDVKPENIMITKDGTVKLIDFNASREFSLSSTRDTVQIGTIGYASPEQLGIAQTDARTDIYALGVLLNVMLTGKHPSIKLADGRAGKIVLKCTQIDPSSRFSSVEKLASEL
ncbi:MAG: serine/threonine protein kinase, partial [Eubacterium sp.]|nr:serine/threonine protein kinase [Eubacterium sp.]